MCGKVTLNEICKQSLFKFGSKIQNNPQTNRAYYSGQWYEVLMLLATHPTMTQSLVITGHA
jgi:hypothetical protein